MLVTKEKYNALKKKLKKMHNKDEGVGIDE